MDIKLVYYKIISKLNKLSTNNEQDVPPHIVVQTFNEEQLHYIEEKFHQFEHNKVRTDELQKLIVYKTLSETKTEDNFTSVKLPEDYFHYVDSVSLVNSDSCREVELYNWLVEESNVNVMRFDPLWSPNIDWRETLVTLSDNKLKVWTNDEFIVSDVKVSYIRYPKPVNIKDGFADLNGDINQDINPEFEGVILEEIIDRVVNNLAATINDANRYQTSTNHKKEND